LKWFARIVDVWRAAGALPVFAAGNGGPGCNTVFSPATSLNAVSVGAVDRLRQACDFSSRGLVSSVKPDLVAPVMGIVSAHPSSALARMSGTSMACPLVAGIAGLVLSVNPSLSVERLHALLLEASVHGVVRQDGCCVDGRCAYGRGLIDAAVAVKLAESL
jgi:subtilisin family serine protease